jgi:hypothetical protein
MSLTEIMDKKQVSKEKEDTNENKTNSPENEKINENELFQITNDFSGNSDFSCIFQNQSFVNIIEQNLDLKTLFSRNNILNSFNSQRMTKFLQGSLVGVSKETINYILNELKGTFREIIKNKNGNYFCSNLIKKCDKNSRLTILTELSSTMCDDCMDEFGTYPIQNLIALASGEDEFKLLLSSFNDSDKILMPSMNAHGTFVVQKLIKHIPEHLRTNFNSIFVNFISVLSRDIYGAYALEKFILYTKNDLIQNQILNIITNDFVNIATNKNGNYLIQNLMKKWWNNKKGETLKKLICSKYHILSRNNYSYYICDLYIKLIKSNQEKESEKDSINTSKK